MKTSAKGKIALAVSEGIVDTAYLDSVGVWTLGIGHTTGAGAPDPKNYIGKKMSIEQIMAMFGKDLAVYEKIVNDNVKVPVLQNEFDSLVHFTYNIGGPNFKKSNLLKNLNAGKKLEAFDKGFHGWLKPAELKGRRDKERDMALSGKYGGTVAPLYTADKNGKTKRNGSIDLSKYNFDNDNGTNVPQPKPTPETPVESGSSGFWETLIALIAKLFGK